MRRVLTCSPQMKISFIQTETQTVRVETKRQTDVVCESSFLYGIVRCAWKLLRLFALKILCALAALW